MPAGARAIWAECLTHAVKHAAFFNDEKAWAQLFALPKMVLGAPSARGGANKRRGGPTREVTDKCRRWLEGERASLWPRAPKTGKARGQAAPAPEELELRAEAFAAEGMLGKATAVFKGGATRASGRGQHSGHEGQTPGGAGFRARAMRRPKAHSGGSGPRDDARGRHQGYQKFPRGIGWGYVGAQTPAPQRRACARSC